MNAEEIIFLNLNLEAVNQKGKYINIIRRKKQMAEKSNIVDFNLFIDAEIAKLFEKVCTENNISAKEVLEIFMKDYIVSGGHPEQVTGGMPWNRKSRPANHTHV